MQLAEFCKKTGASPKQIHYWNRVGIVMTRSRWIGRNDRFRDYDETLIPKVHLLVTISWKMGGWFSVDTLLAIWENYEEEKLDLGDGVILEWRTNARVDVASERCTR